MSAGRLEIKQEGKFPKFVDTVEQVTFNAARAHARGQSVTYVTERGVFRLGDGGPVLVEIAPGIDPERDIATHVGFPLTISDSLETMPASAFDAAPLKLAEAAAAPIAKGVNQ